MPAQERVAVALATLGVLAVAGCGGNASPSADHGSRPSNPGSRATVASTTPTTPQAPAPKIRSAAVDGVRLVREPVVVRDQSGFWVYVRVNRPLPVKRGVRVKASLEVDGAHSGVLIQHAGRCYWQDDDLLGPGTTPAPKVALGTRLHVRLYIGSNTTPIKATAPLRASLPDYLVRTGSPPVYDQHEPYLRLLGCSRHQQPGPVSP